MLKDIKKICAGYMAVIMFSACTAQASKTDTATSSHDTSPVASTETFLAEGSLRLNGGNIETQNADGTWSTFCSVEDFKNAMSLSKDTPAPSASPKQTTSTTVTLGPKGNTGATGPTGSKGDAGATGATGSAGKDGKNGTQVTIDSEGQLILDGIGTGYYLIKKESGDKEKIDAPKNLRVDSGEEVWYIRWDYDYRVAYNEVIIDGVSNFGNYNGYFQVNYLDHDVGNHTVTIKAYPFSDTLDPNSTTETFVVKRNLKIPFSYWRGEYTDNKTTYFIHFDEVDFADSYTVTFPGISDQTVSGNEVKVGENLDPGIYDYTVTANPSNSDLYLPAVYNGRLEIIPPSPEPTPTPITD